MYKVMIVDDEKFIRKSIRNRMDWKKFGITQIEEAGNGEEALLLLDTFCPQIVLVDIRMPKMDGLAFITEAKKSHPEINYIIMSAYSDFSYAKTAIVLGVEAYLLKPVNKDELEALLNKLLHRINEEKLNRMLRSVKVDELEQVGILQYRYCLVLSFYSLREEEQGMRISAIVQNQMAQFENCFAYYLRDCSRSGCYVFLINMKEAGREAGRRCGEAVLEIMEEPLMRAAVSQVFEREACRKAVTQSLSFLKRKLFCPQKRMIANSPWENSDCTDKRRKMRDELEQVYDLIRKDRFDCVADELFGIIEWLILEINPITLIEEGIEEILVLLCHFPRSPGDDMDINILFHDFKSMDYLLLYETAEEVSERLKGLVRCQLAAVKNREGTDVIASIKEHIERNYGDALNVAELAKKYGLIVSYLSTLFKEKTGINLTAYIEGIRMEKAKRFLKEREWTVTEVALHTGYSNSNYFSRVFKKYTGVTPGEFRELERKKQG